MGTSTLPYVYTVIRILDKLCGCYPTVHETYIRTVSEIRIPMIRLPPSTYKMVIYSRFANNMFRISKYLINVYILMRNCSLGRTVPEGVEAGFDGAGSTKTKTGV